MKPPFIAVALFFSFIQGAEAKIVTQCGASEGYAYYFEGGLIAPKDAGWQKDGVSKGGFQLIADDDGTNPDIILTDFIGTRSAKGDGGNVTYLPGDQPGFFQVIAIYPGTGTLEHYLFHLDAAGNGTAAWGLRGRVVPLKNAAS